MSITNTESGTNIFEIADGIYRINTPLSVVPGGFSFNQYLIVDDEPLLFHTGLRRMFPLVREAVATVIPVERLRYVGLSHYEADECGSLNDWLAAAPQAVAVCSRVAAMTSIGDIADRPPRALAEGETILLGKRRVRWFDTPHLPHAWECGFMMEQQTRTLLCGDLFTQPATRRRRLPSRIFSGQANRCARVWTISRTRQTQERCSNDSRARNLRRLRACTAAHGAATEPRCYESWPTTWNK